MANTPPLLIAEAAIKPNRFVTFGTGELQGTAAGVGDDLIGITRAGTFTAPLSDVSETSTDPDAVRAGEAISMIGDGEEGLLTSGAAISAGARLKADATGRGVALALGAGTKEQWGAVALEDAGAADEKIRVQVNAMQTETTET